MNKIIKFLKETHFFNTIKYGFLLSLAIVTLIMSTKTIIYLRAAEQQCYPDGTYLEFIHFSEMLQLLILVPFVSYITILLLAGLFVTFVKSSEAIETVIENNKQIKYYYNTAINNLPSISISSVKTNNILQNIKRIAVYIIFVLYGLAVIGMAITGIYLLFFDDPCQFIN